MDPVADATFLEHLTEIAVVVSLFTAGLKLRVPLSDRQWRTPVRLATLSMAITVGLVAAVGVFALGLPVGVAVLLGAILAPTDPVLAADVQVDETRRPRQAPVRPHRGGRVQRRDRVPVRHARARADGACTPWVAGGGGGRLWT